MIKAARTEDDLEADRLQGALAEELRAARAVAARKNAPVPEVEVELAHERDLRVVPHQEDALAGADTSGADRAHLAVVSALVSERETQLRAQHTGPADVPRRVEVLWVRSSATHAAWCERRHAATLAARGMTRDVICVAQIEGGKVIERWSFG